MKRTAEQLDERNRRRAETARMNKCACGNVVGLGTENGLCGACQSARTEAENEAEVDPHERADAMSSAIAFAIENDGVLASHGFDGGIAWLRAWNEGDLEATRLLEDGLPDQAPVP